jgi:hypothetical protein
MGTKKNLNQNALQAIIDEHMDNMHRDISEQLKARIQNDTWYMANPIEEAERTLSNIMYDMINWQPNMPDGTPYPLAWIRPDIIEKSLAVPVGEVYYGSSKPLPYRWFNEETFEVCYCGEWVEAQSIDWDFSDAVPEAMQKFSEAGKVVRADGCRGK